MHAHCMKRLDFRELPELGLVEIEEEIVYRVRLDRVVGEHRYGSDLFFESVFLHRDRLCASWNVGVDYGLLFWQKPIANVHVRNNRRRCVQRAPLHVDDYVELRSAGIREYAGHRGLVELHPRVRTVFAAHGIHDGIFH